MQAEHLEERNNGRRRRRAGHCFWEKHKFPEPYSAYLERKQ